MNYQKIIDKYYGRDNLLKHILLTHSRSVTVRALRIADRHPELHLDRQFIEEAAMLHDIGIIRCDAPSIQCFGTQPYICHGILGAEMMRSEGHTGAGISIGEIQCQGLPLPERNFLPETLEEQVICYADKFYSKTHLDREKTLEQARQSLTKFGTAGLTRFDKWMEMFE